MCICIFRNSDQAPTDADLLRFPYLQFSNRAGTESNLIAQFQEEHSRVVQLLQSFSFCPENLPPAASAKKPFEKKTLEKQAAKKPLQGPVSVNCQGTFTVFDRTTITRCLVLIHFQPNHIMQTDEHRDGLLARYGPEKLFQAERNFNAAQDLDVSILEGDLVGVIKQQDPMGSQNRWLIDNGGRSFVLIIIYLSLSL